MYIFENTPRECRVDECNESLCVGLRGSLCGIAHFGYQCVALAKFVLQMLWTAQTLELAINHDGYACTQCLTFFHAGNRVDTQYNCSRDSFICPSINWLSTSLCQ